MQWLNVDVKFKDTTHSTKFDMKLVCLDVGREPQMHQYDLYHAQTFRNGLVEFRARDF